MTLCGLSLVLFFYTLSKGGGSASVWLIYPLLLAASYVRHPSKGW